MAPAGAPGKKQKKGRRRRKRKKKKKRRPATAGAQGLRPGVSRAHAHRLRIKTLLRRYGLGQGRIDEIIVEQQALKQQRDELRVLAQRQQGRPGTAGAAAAIAAAQESEDLGGEAYRGYPDEEGLRYSTVADAYGPHGNAPPAGECVVHIFAGRQET